MPNIFGKKQSGVGKKSKNKPNIWAGRFQRIVLGLIIVTLVTLVIISEFEVKSNDFMLNQPAPRNVKARKDITTLFLPEGYEAESFRDNLRRFVHDAGVASSMRKEDGTQFSRAEKVAALNQKKIFTLSEEALGAAIDMGADRLEELRAELVSRIAPAVSSGLLKRDFSAFQLELSRAAREIDGTPAARLLADELLNRNLIHFVPEKKVYFKDQMIIREGDLITSDVLRVLKQSEAISPRKATWIKAVGVFVFVIVSMLSILLYLYQFNKLIYESVGQLTMIGLIILMILFIAKIIILLTRADIEFNNTPLFSPYLIPISTAGMLVAVLIDTKIAISINIIVSVLATIMLETNLSMTFLIVMLISGTMGVYSISRASKRADFVRSGLHISLTNMALIFSLFLMRPDAVAAFGSRIFFRDLVWGFMNGIFSAILGVGTLPFIEMFFRTTTSLSLMELADLNHPLMQRLLKEAPGTYHHSINVGNMSEAAAEQIGADPLLCKVGGYYHDVGKIKRASFFIENQLSGENAHDSLTPNLSALIITSHVRDGIELAKEYKLTSLVQGIIAEHHGTTRIAYFYNRAVKEATEYGKEEIQEFQFRYPGPKPRSKEAAVIMLADAIESVSRTLVKPTPASIKGMVKKISSEKFMDGQFDESNLALKDIEKVEDALVKILLGMFHTRINYPDAGDSSGDRRREDRKRDERRDSKALKEDEVAEETEEDTAASGDDGAMEAISNGPAAVDDNATVVIAAAADIGAAYDDNGSKSAVPGNSAAVESSVSAG